MPPPHHRPTLILKASKGFRRLASLEAEAAASSSFESYCRRLVYVILSDRQPMPLRATEHGMPSPARRVIQLAGLKEASGSYFSKQPPDTAFIQAAHCGLSSAPGR